MKKFISIIAVILSLLLVASFLGACSKDEGADSVSTDTSSSSSSSSSSSGIKKIEPVTPAENKMEIEDDDEEYDFKSIEPVKPAENRIQTPEFEEFKMEKIEPVTPAGNTIDLELKDIDTNFSSDIYTALNDSDLDIDVNKDTGEVTMDSSVLFDVDSYKISEAGKKSLKEFMEEYTSIVFDSKHKDSVNAIVVEGHTDPDGSHEYNQELSQKRANAVMEYCIKLHPEIKDSIAAIGYSYDYPVLKADGSVDKAASRRVVFRVSGK